MVVPHLLRSFSRRRNAAMISMPASGGDTRVLLKYRTAPRAQSWLFSHQAVNDATDIWDFAPAQSEHISRARHLLFMGTMILGVLLSARSRGADQQEHEGHGAPNAPSRRGHTHACRRGLGFVSHKKFPHCGCRHSGCTEIRCFFVCSFPPCTEFMPKTIWPHDSFEETFTARVIWPA
jgi:hypothetical protein